MVAIQSSGLTKTFNGGKNYALNGVSLEIKEGEFIAIIGLSGAGKSTFLRAVNGMNAPGTGDLNVLGCNLHAATPKELKNLRKQIGFIFQQFNLVKNLTVLQNVLVGRVAYAPLWRSLSGLYSSEDIETAKAALKSVGLQGRDQDLVRNLSGGQQQRVAIARALVQNPKIILADEPMASLDPKLSEVVLDILKGINQERKITVLVNIHVLELAKKYATRLIGLKGGQVVFDGAPSELTPERIEDIYEVDPAKVMH